jgi:hypothetical protein
MGEHEPELAIIAEDAISPLTKPKKLSLWGLVKELFNWYPAEYPAEERR